MKYQALSHYKFRRLHAILGLQSTAYTAGHLELIWAHAHQTHPDIKCVEVEFIADWYGEPGKLLDALIECGWLDIVDDSTVQVHDYADHAPSYVKKRDYQKEYMREYRQRKDSLDSVRPNTSNVSPNTLPVSTLLDVVSVPTKHNITKPNITEEICIEDQSNNNSVAGTPKQGLLLNEEDDKEFEEFWKAYPQSEHKDRKTDALKKWKSRKLKKQFTAIMEGLERWKLSKKWSDPQYINNPANWLEGRMWMETPQENPGISKDSLKARLLAAHNVKGLNS
jgi:hypothetical protein